MVHNSGNTAEKRDQEQDEEPSMEEILASIRQIISDDTESEDEPVTRESYTHPTAHANDASSGDAVDTTFETGFEAALEAELGVFDPAPLPAAQTVASQPPKLQEAAPKPSADTGEKSPGVSATAAEGYRELGRLRMEALALQKKAAAAAADGARPDPVHQTKDTSTPSRVSPSFESVFQTKPAPQPASAPRAAIAPGAAGTPVSPRIAPVTPPRPLNPSQTHTSISPKMAMQASSAASADDLAQLILREKSGDVEKLLAEMMRPVVRKWLAENLSGVVERLVREEIEHVSRGRTR